MVVVDIMIEGWLGSEGEQLVMPRTKNGYRKFMVSITVTLGIDGLWPVRPDIKLIGMHSLAISFMSSEID